MAKTGFNEVTYLGRNIPTDLPLLEGAPRFECGGESAVGGAVFAYDDLFANLCWDGAAVFCWQAPANPVWNLFLLIAATLPGDVPAGPKVEIFKIAKPVAKNRLFTGASDVDVEMNFLA